MHTLSELKQESDLKQPLLLQGKKAWIGTPECGALLKYLGLRAHIVDFQTTRLANGGNPLAGYPAGASAQEIHQGKFRLRLTGLESTDRSAQQGYQRGGGVLVARGCAERSSRRVQTPVGTRQLLLEMINLRTTPRI